MPAVKITLADFERAAEEKFGDLVIDVSPEQDDSDLLTLLNPLRLSPEGYKIVDGLQGRLAEVQADAPEIEEARKKYNAAVNRRNTVSEDAPARVLAELDSRMQEELDAYNQAVENHPPDLEQQLKDVRVLVDDMVRAAAKTKQDAERFITEVCGDDLSKCMTLVDQYNKVGQMGEAQSSGS